MVTRADLCSEFAFNNLDRAVTGINQGICDGFYAMNTGMMSGFAGVNSAICNLGYEQAQLSNGTNIALMQGQNAIQTQLADCCCKTQSGLKDVQFANQVGQNAIQTQLASCCCNLGNQIERGFADVRYDTATQTNALQTSMANNTRDIIDSQNAGTRAILDYLCQEKIADLQSENQSLRLAASQQAQNNYLVSQLSPKAPAPAWLVPPPGAVYNPCSNTIGYGNYNNCGCNNGCGNCC